MNKRYDVILFSRRKQEAYLKARHRTYQFNLHTNPPAAGRISTCTVKKKKKMGVSKCVMHEQWPCKKDTTWKHGKDTIASTGNTEYRIRSTLKHGTRLCSWKKPKSHMPNLYLQYIKMAVGKNQNLAKKRPTWSTEPSTPLSVLDYLAIPLLRLEWTNFHSACFSILEPILLRRSLLKKHSGAQPPAPNYTFYCPSLSLSSWNKVYAEAKGGSSSSSGVWGNGQAK